MTLGTLVKYLCGSREAILDVARCPQALWIGLLFVLAAGFAREYDGADLLHEPWHLAIPLGASIASSAVLYCLVRLVAWRHGVNQPGLASGYRTFLTLYWMTAPLALLYAVPVERFLSAGDATRANLWFLAIVSVWRVLLITRVIAVAYSASFAAAWWIVMFFANSLVLTILSQTPLPILSFMGGIRLSESEQTIQLVTLLLGILAFYSWPIWLIGFIVVLAIGNPSKREHLSQVTQSLEISRGLWNTAALAVGIWIIVLPFTQPEQLLRHRVEVDLHSGRIREGLELISAHERNEFPPHWDPPPRISYRGSRPDIVEVQECQETLHIKPWVRRIFDEKFVNSLRGRNDYLGVWEGLTPDEIERRLKLLQRLENLEKAVVELQEGLMFLAERQDMPEDIRSCIRKLLDEAKNSSKAAQQDMEPQPDAGTP